MQNQAENAFDARLVPTSPEEIKNLPKGPDAPLESVVWTDNGMFRKPYTQKDVDRAADFKAREMFAEQVKNRLGESVSGAASWLMTHRAKHRDFVQAVEFQDEAGASVERHFVKRLSDSDIVEIGVLMARGGFSLLSMEDIEAQHAFNVAILAVGVCDEEGGRFFADAEEARLLYEAPNAGQTSAILRGAVFGLNPAFASDAKKKMAPAPKRTP